MTEAPEMTMDLTRINLSLGRNAQGLVDWAVGLRQPAIITTNFRPFEAVILRGCQGDLLGPGVAAEVDEQRIGDRRCSGLSKDR